MCKNIHILSNLKQFKQKKTPTLVFKKDKMNNSEFIVDISKILCIFVPKLTR